MKTEAIFTLYLLIALFLAPATIAGFVMAATFALSAWCITEGVAAYADDLPAGTWAGVRLGRFALAAYKAPVAA
jgi:hypothetical protein